MKLIKNNQIYNIEKIYKLVEDKAVIDQNTDWCQGSSTLFAEIRKELDEAESELNDNRKCYLEDELGDILWDYLNLLKNLELEDKIEANKVFERCAKKYTERLKGIKNGHSWDIVKNKQKEELKKEQDLL